MSVITGNSLAADVVQLFVGTTSANNSGANTGPAIDTNGSASVVWEVTGNTTFQMSIEGSNDQNFWVTLWSLPLSEVAQVDTINQNGLYVFDADTRYIRYNMAFSADTLNHNVYGRDSTPASAAGRLSAALDPLSNIAMSTIITNLKIDKSGALITSDAIGPFVATLQNAFANAIYDTTGYNNIIVQQSAGAATTVTVSNDGITWIAVQGVNLQTGAVVTTLAATGVFAFSCSARFIRFQGTGTAGYITSYFRTTDDPSAVDTVNLAQIGGAAVNQASSQLGINIVNVAGSALNPGLSQFGVNVANIGGTAAAAAVAAGSTNKVLGVSHATAVSQVDIAAGNLGGAGRINGTVIASAQGGGGVITSGVLCTVTTLGTATALYLILQESQDGTNFTDIWTSDPFTTTQTIRVPAIIVQGRRRWALHSVGGTSTTIAITPTTLELSSANFPWMRQSRDAFNATNPLASVIGGTTQAASTLVLTTLNSTTTVFNIEGCTQVTYFITVAAGTPGTNPILQIQTSMDGTSWANTASANLTPTAAGTFMNTVVNQPAKYGRLLVTTASATGTPYTISNLGSYGIR